MSEPLPRTDLGDAPAPVPLEGTRARVTRVSVSKVAPSPTSPEEGSGAVPPDAPMLQELRLLRTEIQDLRSVLDLVRRGEAPVARFVEYIRRTRKQVRAILSRIHSSDDCVRRIRNAWEQIESCELVRRPGGNLDLQIQIQCLNLLDVLCRQIIYGCSCRTIPARLAEWLEDTRPGYAIPFHALFEDEVPDAEDRQKILNHLALVPNLLKPYGGMADPDAGMIYRYEQVAWKRVLSLGLVVLAVLAATGVALLLHALAPVDGQGVERLLVGWAAVLGGTVVHVGVGAAKRVRAAGAMVVVSAREGFILLRVVMALVGYLAFVYGIGMTAATGVQSYVFNAFLVGYSLDSVMELLGAGLNRRAGLQAAALRR
ncbi:MAG TPA: hypothetical protein VHG28_24105 [Longimicrobiaceae bacterium]|nr:hypothetical protein [Longimicrobiaceae bacterium]